MATPERAGRGNATATTIANNKWGPYSGAGDFAGNMAVILVSLLAALALALALHAGVMCLLRRRRRRRQRSGVEQGRGGGLEDPEKPPVVAQAPPPPPPLLVYSASGTRLAGAAAHECAICLAEFADGDAVRAMPACCHGFHARCIERWPAYGGGERLPRALHHTLRFDFLPTGEPTRSSRVRAEVGDGGVRRRRAAYGGRRLKSEGEGSRREARAVGWERRHHLFFPGMSTASLSFR